jgi:F-type H+-transporting ATPase subunit b
MALSWSTFALEIINFLVLVWILKRFLYKPVLGVIARRRAGIESVLARAQEKQAAAEALKAEYETRLTAWDQERAQAREALTDELDQRRSHELAALRDELEQQREKARVGEARRRADAQRRMEQTALAQGARFAARLLGQAACPDVESRLIELTIGELGRLPAARVAALRNTRAMAADEVVVTTAFPLADDQGRRLEARLREVVGLAVPVRFDRNDSLLAGVRMTFGAWVLGMNLRDELQGFRELADAS